MINMAEKWYTQVNDLVGHHRYIRDGVLIRFGATKYPFPTVSIQVFEDNEKIAEWSITRLEALISDLEDALNILKQARIEYRKERRQEREEESEDEENNDSSKRSRKDYRKRRSRKPKRD